MLISTHELNHIKYKISCFFQRSTKKPRKSKMSLLSTEHRDKLLAELELINLTLRSAREKYAYYMRNLPDRTSTDAAISELNRKKAEIELTISALNDFLGA